MAKKTFYITTAIDYVNSVPHVGHAFEKVLADALARYRRLLGCDLFFLTGVDENAQKNVEAAEKAGVPVKEFIDKNAASFIELCDKLNISYNDFIRTTAKEHAVVVQKIVKKIMEKGDIYKGTYEGLYCVGCETYYTEKDLVDGKCPEHNTAPEKRREEAYFFKLGKYKNRLLKIIPKYVVPEFRANEILARIKNDGLNDICISRKGAKWGIDIPGDPEFKIWVWIDALINYISGLKDKEKIYWPADVHVIGKGINWFHSVIWPAILLSAGYKLHKKLMVHGYLITGGKKMSKSLGNVISPLELLDKYSSDVIRYSLLKCSVFDDSDYSEEILIERNNNELANKLGNLIMRVSTLAEKYGLTKTPIKTLNSGHLQNKIVEYFDNLEFDKALNDIFSFIDECNTFIQEKKPWEESNKDKKEILYELSNAIKDFTILLSPFIPETCEKISKTFNFSLTFKDLKAPLKVTRIIKSDILFKKVDIDINDNKTLSPTPKPVSSSSSNSKLSQSPKKSNKVVVSDRKEKPELRVGKIIEVKEHPDADRLYILNVDFGSERRTIVAGLRKRYSKEELLGKKAVFITNLEPAKIRGIESKGMILAAATDDDSEVYFIKPKDDVKEGSKVEFKDD